MSMVTNRSLYLTYADGLKHPGNFTPAIQSFFNQDATINIVHPFNKLNGSKAYIEQFILPLQYAFKGLYRRDDILMVGDFEGQKWVSSTGYYIGQFAADWIGISPTLRLSYLR